ncbi:unnamed protein product [Mytilus edulis]|uniref:Ankyrin repeat protein n=1 Tax=Mytilus edulis TaxID=6550 RepID=A0A8S3U9J5_MYTED|nr:unnamed protein product [Mytilus edulis]
MVSTNEEYKYNDRIKADLENGKIHCCLNNAQMKYKKYRIMFRDIIKDLEINLIRNLINIKDGNGINSFIIACLRGYDELVDFLISVGADVDGRVGFFTPLTAACHDGHLNTVEILLKGGSNIDDDNTQGETPLYTACVGGHYNLVNLLIEKEADINKQNKYSRTPLYASCLLGHAAIVSLLIDKGVNVYQYEDLLIAATLGGNDKIVESILSKGCCLNSVDIEGKTALFIACEEGNTNIVELLTDNNADIYIVGSDGRTPLHAACCVGNNDIVRILVNKNADVDMIDVYLETPLHKSCRKGSEDVILTLLDNGADTKKTNKDGHAPIYLAKTEGKIVNENILKVLGDKEIGPSEGLKTTEIGDLDYKVDGKSLIKLACEHGSIKAIKILPAKGADFKERDINGRTLMQIACNTDSVGMLQFLEDNGSDINIPDKDGYVCLRKKILLQNGTDVNKIYKYGYTPMILADIGGNDELSEYLQNHTCFGSSNSEYSIFSRK